MIDLWPEQIATVERRAPVIILREQASLLANKTKGIVEAEVVAGDAPAAFAYDFVIVAPALGGYRYRLFRMRHDVTFYPCEIEFESGGFEQVRCNFRLLSPSGLRVESEEELLRALKEIFASDKTMQVIQAILAQSGS
jgi:hypothetical protein